MVAVTVHVPALVAERLEPESVQPAVPEEVTVNVTVPVPDPPLVVNTSAEPYVPEVFDTVSDACAVPELKAEIVTGVKLVVVPSPG